ncbi:hypothetical protein, partial [Klebsiella pneumoniae]|uniref:hypothetical protein n=1 Tax=Klebsiella pneumoniae TaxID=573 RepID=UPI003F8EAAB3
RLSVWFFKWLVEGDFRVLPRAFHFVLHAGKTRHPITDQLVDQEQSTTNGRRTDDQINEMCRLRAIFAVCLGASAKARRISSVS